MCDAKGIDTRTFDRTNFVDIITLLVWDPGDWKNADRQEDLSGAPQ